MSHPQIRLFCHGITLAALQYMMNRSSVKPKLHLKRYGCERYTEGDNNQNPDFYANITMIPDAGNGRESISKCGYCLEANYDSNYVATSNNGNPVIRLFLGIRNDDIDGVVNPEVIYRFLSIFHDCETCAKNHTFVNLDHWIAWIRLSDIDLAAYASKIDLNPENEGIRYFNKTISVEDKWKRFMKVFSEPFEE